VGTFGARTILTWLGASAPAAAALWTTGCSDAGIVPVECPSAQAAAITFGTADETFLSLGAEDMHAIARLHAGTPDAGSTCTATLIRREWLLTAGHCLRIRPLLASIGTGGAPQIQIEEVVEHPERDVALLRVAAEAFAGARPVMLNAAAPDAAWIGERVELAGYGWDEAQLLDGLRFAVETVSEVGESTIGVHGHGRSGACLGDSGGPLLMRDQQGRPAVAGILTTGSESCRHHDTYVRADRLRDWVNAIAGAPEWDLAACGEIDESGGCWFGNALACVDGTLEVSVCEGGTACGWDPARGRFACVEPLGDPCQGAGSAGRCFGDVARRCDAGVVSEQVCGACEACRYAPASGQPECPTPG
jgi:hypothetical protein